MSLYVDRQMPLTPEIEARAMILQKDYDCGDKDWYEDVVAGFWWRVSYATWAEGGSLPGERLCSFSVTLEPEQMCFGQDQVLFLFAKHGATRLHLAMV